MKRQRRGLETLYNIMLNAAENTRLFILAHLPRARFLPVFRYDEEQSCTLLSVPGPLGVIGNKPEKEYLGTQL